MSKTITIHRFEDVRAAAEKCVHFGFCTAVCPTYVLDSEEKDSPRGRIALAREMLASGAPPSAEAVRHLDRCLSCLSCETTCAAGVSYRDVIDGAREYIERSGVRPLPERMFRSALAHVLTRPALLRPAMRAGRVLAPLGKRLPGSLGALARLAQAPALQALRGRAASLPAAPAEPRHRVALLSGCAQSVLGEEINAAALRLLARAGIAVEPTDEALCCGALDLHMGRRAAATARMAALVEACAGRLAAGEVDAIVVTTSGCASVIKHYDDVLSDRPDLADAVRRVMAATVDLTELAQALELPATGVAQGAAVAYHDACSLKHGLKLKRPPRKSLQAAGLDVREIAESHLCCGSAGTYNVLQPAISERLGARKAGHASAGAPDVIAAGNLGCLVQISRFTDVPVAHTVQLLDWATGGPAPRGLEAFQPRFQPRAEPPAAPVEAAVPAAPATPDTGDSLW